MTDALDRKARRPEAVLPASPTADDHSEGMSYLESLPRRLVTLYLPLGRSSSSCCCSRSTGWR